MYKHQKMPWSRGLTTYGLDGDFQLNMYIHMCICTGYIYCISTTYFLPKKDLDWGDGGHLGAQVEEDPGMGPPIIGAFVLCFRGQWFGNFWGPAFTVQMYCWTWSIFNGKVIFPLIYLKINKQTVFKYRLPILVIKKYLKSWHPGLYCHPYNWPGWSIENCLKP